MTTALEMFNADNIFAAANGKEKVPSAPESNSAGGDSTRDSPGSSSQASDGKNKTSPGSGASTGRDNELPSLVGNLDDLHLLGPLSYGSDNEGGGGGGKGELGSDTDDGELGGDDGPLVGGNVDTDCPYCHKPFRKPHVLACLHSMCEDCIIAQLEGHRFASGRQHSLGGLPIQAPPPSTVDDDCLEPSTGPVVRPPPGVIRCPICKQDSNVGNDIRFVSQLLLDYVRMNECELRNLHKVQRPCEACKGPSAAGGAAPSSANCAVALCQDCGGAKLCDNCLQAHKFMRCFEGHKVITFDEIKQAYASGERIPLNKPVMCVRHPQELYKSLCISCDVGGLCKKRGLVGCVGCFEDADVRQCEYLDHPPPEHRVMQVDEQIDNAVRGELNALSDDAERKVSESETAHAKAEELIGGLDDRLEQARLSVEEAFETYKQMLDARKQSIMEELGRAREECEKQLNANFDQIDRGMVKIMDAVHFTRRLTKKAGTMELLDSRTVVKQQLASLKSGAPNPNFTVDLAFAPDESAFKTALYTNIGAVRQGVRAISSQGLVVDARSGVMKPDTVVSPVSSTSSYNARPTPTPPISHPPVPIPTSSYVSSSSSTSNYHQQQPPIGLHRPTPVAPSTSTYASSGKFGNFGGMVPQTIGQQPMMPSGNSWMEPTNMRPTMPLPAPIGQWGAIGAGSGHNQMQQQMPTYPNQYTMQQQQQQQPKIPSGLAVGQNRRPSTPHQLHQQPSNGWGQPPQSMMGPNYSAIVDNAAESLLRQHPPNQSRGRTPVTETFVQPAAIGGERTSSVTPTDPPPPAISTVVPPRGARPPPHPMKVLTQVGSLGAGTNQFNSPHGFCLGVEDTIVVADTNNHKIQLLKSDGSAVGSFGRPGKCDGELFYPRKVALIRGREPKYVVCDRGMERSRMQVFNMRGEFIKKIIIRYVDIVAGLAVDSDGRIVVVDSVSPTVFRINADSGELEKWFDCSDFMKEPSDIAVFNSEYYICDFKGNCVCVFSEDGRFMRKIGSEDVTPYPNGIDVSNSGDVLIGDSHGNKFHVSVFKGTGQFIQDFECPSIKVSRCCGLRITGEGKVITLLKNNHCVLVMDTLYVA